MSIQEKLSLSLAILGIFGFQCNASLAQDGNTTITRVTKTETSSSTVSKKALPNNSRSFRGVSFKNANKIEFKYQERIKNFKEQLEMGRKKGWLTEQEILEFKEKISVLESMEKKVRGKNYPKNELDQMEKMFTLYNQEFYKASNTPMSKKKSTKKKKIETKTNSSKKG